MSAHIARDTILPPLAAEEGGKGIYSQSIAA
jgi:hypothetical protein